MEIREGRGATSLIELLLALAIMGTICTLTIPSMARLLRRGDALSSQCAMSLGLTMEELIGRLSNARLILSPRAKIGARRGRILLFLNEENELSLVYSNGEKLIYRHLRDNEELKIVSRVLGNCSAAIFHDRGHTRRCMRLRLRLNSYVLATTVKLHNSWALKEKLPKFSSDVSVKQKSSFSEQLQRAKERYRKGVSPITPLLEAAFEKKIWSHSHGQE